MNETVLPTDDDPYSHEIIAKARELSPELDDYVVGREWMNAIHEDEITAVWLRNRLITMLVEQLEDRGVRVEMDRDDICDNPRLVQTVLYLRAKVDFERMCDFLEDHTESLKTVQGLLVDTDNLIETMAVALNQLNPLDEGWECIVATMNLLPGIITSTKDFSNLVERVLDQVDRLGDPDSVTVVGDFENVADYVKFLGDRKAKILKLASVMYSGGIVKSTAESGGEVAKSVTAQAQVTVEGFMRNFEVELARPNVVEKIGDKEATTKLINDTRKSCAERWRHTLEHWISDKYRGQEPTLLDVAVMTATLYVDLGSPANARVKIIETFESCADLLGDRYLKIRELLDDALANLVVYQEQGGGVSIAE